MEKDSKSRHIDIDFVDSVIHLKAKRLILLLGFSINYASVILNVIQTDTMRIIKNKPTKLALSGSRKKDMLYLPSSNLLAITSRTILKFLNASASFKSITEITFDKSINAVDECKTLDRLLIGGEFPELYFVNTTYPYQREILVLDIGPVITLKAMKNDTRIGLITKSRNRLVFKVIEVATQKIVQSIDISGFNPLRTSFKLLAFFDEQLAFLFSFMELDELNKIYQKKGFGIWRFYPACQEEVVEFNTCEESSIRRIEEIRTSVDELVLIKVQAKERRYIIVKENDSIDRAELYSWHRFSFDGFSDLVYVSADTKQFLFLRGCRLVYQDLRVSDLESFASASYLLNHNIFTSCT